MSNKYIKYKKKYLNLKNQLGGDTINGTWEGTIQKKGDINYYWNGMVTDEHNKEVNWTENYTIIPKSMNRIFISIIPRWDVNELIKKFTNCSFIMDNPSEPNTILLNNYINKNIVELKEIVFFLNKDYEKIKKKNEYLYISQRAIIILF